VTVARPISTISVHWVALLANAVWRVQQATFSVAILSPEFAFARRTSKGNVAES